MADTSRTTAPGAHASVAEASPESRRAAPVACHEPSGVRFAVGPGEVLLDEALSHGLALEHGCRVGACGACAIEIVEGLEHASRPDPIEADALARYHLPSTVRLACRLRITGPLTFRGLE